MSEQQATTAEWRKLYEAASKVKALAPWEWMFEDEVFGVQDPETGETGFISVMGSGGAHLAVALYPHATALYDFLALHDAGSEAAEDGLGDDPLLAMRVLEIPQLQASFEDNKQLDKGDKAVIKQLGLKFRGAQAWPQFRSFTPGLFPWRLTGAEARRLTNALTQLLDVAPRCRAEEELLAPSEDATVFVVRVPRKENGRLVWEDQIQTIDEPEPAELHLAINLQNLAQAKALPRVDNALEIELMMMPMPMQEKKDQRPYFPYLLFIAEAKSGQLLGNELLQPLPSLSALHSRLPQLFIEKFIQLGVLPGLLRARNPLLADLLEPLGADLGFTVELTHELPGIDGALDFLGQMMPGTSD